MYEGAVVIIGIELTRLTEASSLVFMPSAVFTGYKLRHFYLIRLDLAVEIASFNIQNLCRL